jgi:hypothetical protein
MVPVLALGLQDQWEQREGGLWCLGLDMVPKLAQEKLPLPPTPPAHSPEQRAEALALVRSGVSLRKVAAQFPGVSYGAIWRLMRAEASRGQIEGSNDEEDVDEAE